MTERKGPTLYTQLSASAIDITLARMQIIAEEYEDVRARGVESLHKESTSHACVLFHGRLKTSTDGVFLDAYVFIYIKGEYYEHARFNAGQKVDAERLFDRKVKAIQKAADKYGTPARATEKEEAAAS